MKKVISLVLIVMLMSAFFVNVSAAPSGTDVLETFEYYPSNAALVSMWHERPIGSHKVTLDASTSCPNRANGEAKGNYRSLKLEYDATVPDWYRVRNITENPYSLVELVEKNGNGKFTFYAKADKDVVLRAGLTIKDDPCTNVVTVGTEWKKYEIDFRDMVPDANENKHLTFMEITRQGLWPAGKQEPYLCGFIFSIESRQTGTLWIDTLAIEGDYISEIHNFTDPSGYSYDTEYDRDGNKPSGFVPVTSSNSQPTTSSSGGNSSTVSSAITTSKITSSREPDSVSDTNKSDNTKSNANITTSKSTSSRENDSVSDASESGVTSSGESSIVVSSDELDASDALTLDMSSSDSSDEVGTKDEGGNNLKIVILVIAIIAVLAGGGCAFYFLYWKKKTSDDVTI